MAVQSLDDISGRRNGAETLRRLRWIDDRLRWMGAVRRSDLVSHLGVSPQQASADLATYMGIVPSNVAFDPRTKSYSRAAAFTPVFAGSFIGWAAGGPSVGDASVIPVETVPQPSRNEDSAILAVVADCFGRRVPARIDYQSLTSAGPSVRAICPHHVVDTHDRLHLRAWDYHRGIFTDFLLSRTSGALPDSCLPWIDGAADRDWHEFEHVVLRPRADLSAAQRRVVEADYGMHGGRVAVSVRRALLIYLLDKLGLLGSVRGKPDGTDRHRAVTCENAGDLRALLPEAAV